MAIRCAFRSVIIYNEKNAAYFWLFYGINQCISGYTDIEDAFVREL